MATNPPASSIRSLDPLEQGGTANRRGIDFQDHVAAGICIDMLADESISEVWCETQDDVTVIRNSNGSETVEFVQVKNHQGRLWSIPFIAETDESGKCLVERSLAYDRCSEGVTFRVVSSFPTNNDLKSLTLSLNSDARNQSAADITAIVDDLQTRLASVVSSNGHKVDFWVRNVWWDYCGDTSNVKRLNFFKLENVITVVDDVLYQDQREEIYNHLVLKVYNAGLETKRELKLFKRLELRDWLIAEIEKARAAIKPTAGHAVLREKLHAAGLDTILSTAIEQKMAYRNWRGLQGYLTFGNPTLLETEVRTVLSSLSLRLQSGEFADSTAFYLRCVSELDTLGASLAWPEPGGVPRALLNGCMFEITGRCHHRFMRPTT